MTWAVLLSLDFNHIIINYQLSWRNNKLHVITWTYCMDQSVLLDFEFCPS